MTQCQAAIEVIYRHQAAVEMAIFYGVVGALLGCCRQRVHCLPVYTFKCGYRICAYALVRLRILLTQVQVIAVDKR